MENNNKNYGHQLKITRYMIQRAYFEGMLRYHIDNPAKDGDFSERYVGHIFPENVLWLNENGIKVHTSRVSDPTSKFFDCELNIFTISDDIKLTEDEIEESNEHCANLLSSFAEENFKDLMKAFGICDDDENDDVDDVDFSLPEFDDEDDLDDEVKPPYSV